MDGKCELTSRVRVFPRYARSSNPTGLLSSRMSPRNAPRWSHYNRGYASRCKGPCVAGYKRGNAAARRIRQGCLTRLAHARPACGRLCGTMLDSLFLRNGHSSMERRESVTFRRGPGSFLADARCFLAAPFRAGDSVRHLDHPWARHPRVFQSHGHFQMRNQFMLPLWSNIVIFRWLYDDLEVFG